MSVLPDEVNSTLLEVLHGFTSPDNEVRAQAEATLNQQWITSENIEVLLMFLAEQASFPSDHTISALSAVLFRKLALRAPPLSKTIIIAKNITHISPNVLTQIRATLLKGFTSDKPSTIRHKLSDAIAECAQDDLPPWPELLNTVVDCLGGSNDDYKESSFRILASVPHLVNEVEVTNILSLFERGFVDHNDDVRIASVTAFVGYFKQLPKEHWQKIGMLLPSLLNSLPRFLDDGKDEALVSIFESLIELVELAPKLFKDLFDNIMQFVNIVIKNGGLDTSARTTALEFLTVFSENAPQMCKSNENYAHSLIMNSLLMMTEVSLDDEEALEWQQSDDTDEEEEATYDHARQALDRVSLKLGGKYLAPTLFQFLQQMISSSLWRERYAALMALSSAAEGCQDVLMGEIPKILDMVLPLITDPHPRVQYGCCNVLGQISTDFASLIQRTSHDRILPALISRLTPACVDRVQTHAAAALVNFSEHATQSIMEPYLDDLLTNLLKLLQNDKVYVQEQALTTIAFIAEAAEKQFVKYYDALMPLLLNGLKTDSNGVLQGKCIECATLIAMAVGKDKFSDHSNELINALITIQNSGIQDDNPIKSYLEHGWSRICRILREDFVPLLPLVLPPIMESAKATQDVSLIEEEEASNFQQYQEWDVVQIQGKHIAIHTSILDDKVTSMELLQIYCTVLKGSFANYVEEIMTQIAIPSIDFYLHDGVRATGASLIPVLLSSLVAATGLGNEELATLWHRASTKLISGIISEPMLLITQIYHSSLVDCLSIMSSLSLTDDLMIQYTKGATANLTDIYTRVKERNGENDEYNEEIDDDLDGFTDEDLLDEINKSLRAILESSNGAYIEHFQSLWPLITTYLQENDAILQLFALVAISDLIKFAGDRAAAFKDSVMPQVAQYLLAQDPSIRQAAAYVIGCCSEFAPSTFGDVALSSLDTLFQILAVADANSEDNQRATDNASAAIAKTLFAFQANIPTVDNYIANWLKSLPTLSDDDAATANYQYLAHLIDSKYEPFYDPGVVPVILDSVVQALHHNALYGDSASVTVESVKKLMGTLPQQEAVALMHKYPPEVIKTCEVWFA